MTCNNVVGSGYWNQHYGNNFGFIGSGDHNFICASATGAVVINPANHSFIGTGLENRICSSYSAIVSGSANFVNVDGNCSFIGSGANNIIEACNAAILGGCGNFIGSAYCWAGVFGCDVNAVNCCAFHANNFFAQNMPDEGGISGCASGTFYYCSSTKAVYIT